MRAFAVDEFGASGSIHEVPIPEPGDGEVLVTVHAAGVNVMDPLYVAGAMKEHMEHRFPLVPGIDLAGVVERVGPGVDRFAAGDEVYGVSAKPFVGAGTFAEFVAVGVDNVAPKPESLNFVEAAAVPHVGLTALAAIEAADPLPGQVVVVIGATGGVGSFVTQLADYEAGDVGAALRARYPEGVDTVISTYGDLGVVTGAARALRSGGLVVSPAIRPDAAEAAFGELGVTFKSANRLPPARLPELTALIVGGQLRVPPVTVFPLDATDAALSEMAGGHVRGKLVIAVR